MKEVLPLKHLLEALALVAVLPLPAFERTRAGCLTPTTVHD
jgi:hypothetical protein